MKAEQLFFGAQTEIQRKVQYAAARVRLLVFTKVNVCFCSLLGVHNAEPHTALLPPAPPATLFHV